MVNPIPDAIKEILGALTPAQQVTMRSYIASLRSEIKDLEADLLAKNDEDPHAHYHGHDKCTEDHAHSDKVHDSHHTDEGHEHEREPKKHKEDDHHHHDHKPHATKAHGEEHHGHDHKHTAECTHDHAHQKEEEAKHDGHHGHHEHHGHHGHGHDHHEKKDDVPEWKKKALEKGNDPNAAPFGGSWNAESNISASDNMEE
jgi:hypothetical protein